MPEPDAPWARVAPFQPDPPPPALRLTQEPGPARLGLARLLISHACGADAAPTHTSISGWPAGGKYHFQTAADRLQLAAACRDAARTLAPEGDPQDVPNFLSELPSPETPCLYLDLDLARPFGSGFLDPLRPDRDGWSLAEVIGHLVCEVLVALGLPLAAASSLAGDCVWSSASGVAYAPPEGASWATTLAAWDPARLPRAGWQGGRWLMAGPLQEAPQRRDKSSFTVVFRCVRGPLVRGVQRALAQRLDEACLLPPGSSWEGICDSAATSARLLDCDKLTRVRLPGCARHGAGATRLALARCSCVQLRAWRPLRPLAAYQASSVPGRRATLQAEIPWRDFVQRSWLSPPPQAAALPLLAELAQAAAPPRGLAAPGGVCRALAWPMGCLAPPPSTGRPPGGGAGSLRSWEAVPPRSERFLFFRALFGAAMAAQTGGGGSALVQSLSVSDADEQGQRCWRGWLQAGSQACPVRSAPGQPYFHSGNRVSFFLHPYLAGGLVRLYCASADCRDRLGGASGAPGSCRLTPEQYQPLSRLG